MTKPLFTLFFGASLVLSLASACDSGNYGYGPGWAGGGDPCNQYASCGACTPVNGCGWCTTGVGQGTCASDPNECANATAFSWTWEPDGCFVAADAGVASSPADAGTSTSSGNSLPDAATAAPDASQVSTTDAQGPDAGTLADASETSDASDAASVGD
jgi:hypothetical protein